MVRKLEVNDTSLLEDRKRTSGAEMTLLQRLRRSLLQHSKAHVIHTAGVLIAVVSR